MKQHQWLCAARAVLFGLPFCPLARADFYVSPNGSDAGAGTMASPFGSLEKARDAVPAAKQSGQAAGGAVSVWLRAGDFVRTNALVLTAADSGTESAPVFWRAYGAERLRLLGGRILNDFQPVKHPAVLSRLEEAARSHVLQIDLRGRGITNFGEMRSRGFGRATT